MELINKIPNIEYFIVDISCCLSDGQRSKFWKGYRLFKELHKQIEYANSDDDRYDEDRFYKLDKLLYNCPYLEMYRYEYVYYIEEDEKSKYKSSNLSEDIIYEIESFYEKNKLFSDYVVIKSDMGRVIHMLNGPYHKLTTDSAWHYHVNSFKIYKGSKTGILYGEPINNEDLWWAVSCDCCCGDEISWNRKMTWRISEN